jgi:hypothetical protein
MSRLNHFDLSCLTRQCYTVIRTCADPVGGTLYRSILCNENILIQHRIAGRSWTTLAKIAPIEYYDRIDGIATGSDLRSIAVDYCRSV